MSENSKIEWTDHTFNPWKICTPVSPGCKNCYAAALAKRWGWGEYKKGVPRQLTGDANWREPLKWNAIADSFRECPSCGRRDHMAESCPLCGTLTIPARQRVFCASLSDWLDDEVPTEWRARLLNLIYQTPHLDWLLLTKRPQNWKGLIIEAVGRLTIDYWVYEWIGGKAPSNIWMGTTVEDQTRAEERIPQLLQIPAKVRFLSCEPLLGAVDIRNGIGSGIDVGLPRVNWVICGGESGPEARPMNPDWARSLRDQCLQAHVPFFFKQWGEWVRNSDIHSGCPVSQIVPFGDGDPSNFRRMYRVGKKAAGRLLDCVEHSAFPA